MARECYQVALAPGKNHKWMINEPEPILEPSETPQGVEIVPGDSTKILKIETAFPTKMFSLGNTRICPGLIGRSYNILSMSTQSANL